MGASGVTEKPAERAELVSIFKPLVEEAERQKPKRRKKADAALPASRPLPELAGAKVLIVDDDIRNI